MANLRDLGGTTRPVASLFTSWGRGRGGRSREGGAHPVSASWGTPKSSAAGRVLTGRRRRGRPSQPAQRVQATLSNVRQFVPAAKTGRGAGVGGREARGRMQQPHVQSHIPIEPGLHKEGDTDLRARVLRAVEVEAALAHAEAAHLAVRGRVDLAAPVLVRVRGQLVVVEPGARHVVSSRASPSSRRGCRRTSRRSFFFGHGLLLLGDARGVVRRRREADGLPDGLDLRAATFRSTLRIGMLTSNSGSKPPNSFRPSFPSPSCSS